MDPNACMDRILRAIREKDYAEARDAIGDVNDWLDGGGFAPDSVKLDALQLAIEAAGASAPERLVREAMRLCQRLP